MRLFAIALTLVLAARTAHAAPTDLCESAVERAASKFMACRLDAESKHTRTLDLVKRDQAMSKCVEKFTQAFTSSKSRNGAENCTTVAEADLRTYMKDCSDGIEGASGLAGVLPTCSGDLLTCSTDVAACMGSLGTCAGDKATCQTGLTMAQGDLVTCTTGKTACEGNLATAQAGTATAGEVLAGKTFASAAGLSSTGSMSNRGAVTITPATSDQAIAAGYHDGAGRVAGDPDLLAGNIVSGVSIFDVMGTAMTNGLLSTGQKTSYGPGSDGDLQTGTGQSLTDNGDGTITDNRTGLMWEVKDNSGEIHDWDNTYTWGQATSPYSMNGTIATIFLASLNAEPCFTNRCDWRIPNIKELHSLMDYEVFSPVTFGVFNTPCTAGCQTPACSCTKSDFYWTSSTARSLPSYAWRWRFADGYVDNFDKTTAHHVRAVRAGH